MCPLSGETTVIYVTLGTCYSVWMTVEGGMKLHPAQSSKVGFIYKIIQGCTVNKTFKKLYIYSYEKK